MKRSGQHALLMSEVLGVRTLRLQQYSMDARRYHSARAVFQPVEQDHVMAPRAILQQAAKFGVGPGLGKGQYDELPPVRS